MMVFGEVMVRVQVIIMVGSEVGMRSKQHNCGLLYFLFLFNLLLFAFKKVMYKG